MKKQMNIDMQAGFNGRKVSHLSVNHLPEGTIESMLQTVPHTSHIKSSTGKNFFAFKINKDSSLIIEPNHGHDSCTFSKIPNDRFKAWELDREYQDITSSDVKKIHTILVETLKGIGLEVDAGSQAKTLKQFSEVKSLEEECMKTQRNHFIHSIEVPVKKTADLRFARATGRLITLAVPTAG